MSINSDISFNCGNNSNKNKSYTIDHNHCHQQHYLDYEDSTSSISSNNIATDNKTKQQHYFANKYSNIDKHVNDNECQTNNLQSNRPAPNSTSNDSDTQTSGADSGMIQAYFY